MCLPVSLYMHLVFNLVRVFLVRMMSRNMLYDSFENKFSSKKTAGFL